MDDYYLLGRSGLRVSRLALGAMTFGNGGIRGIGGQWGADEAAARAIFHRYVAAGGNFIDTANSYGAGLSESLVGSFIADAGLRDRMVIATKFSNNLHPGNPNGGGNGRKSLMQAVDASLQRLKTDYIDLYLLHTWDRMTPVQETMRGFDDLVRAGKIRYVGLSDVPGWYAAQAQTWAHAHALTPPICLQLPYSLIERSIEHEFVPMADALGLGITAWSPLAMGLLSGKYRAGKERNGRLAHMAEKAAPGSGCNARAARILEVLAETACEIERSMTQVALNWCVNRPGIAAAIIGARLPEQLEESLGCLDFDIPAEFRARLDAVSALDPPYPYSLFADDYQAGIIHTGVAVGDKPAGYRLDIALPKIENYVFGQGKEK